VSGIKDFLLVKVERPKTSDLFEEKSKVAKRVMEVANIDEIAFTELMLSMDVRQ
jgi:hypothetical protein